ACLALPQPACRTLPSSRRSKASFPPSGQSRRKEMTKHFMPRASLAALMAARPAAVIGAVRSEANPGKIEELLKDVKSELTRISDDVKKTAEEALRQAKDAGTVTSDVKAKA